MARRLCNYESWGKMRKCHQCSQCQEHRTEHRLLNTVDFKHGFKLFCRLPVSSVGFPDASPFLSSTLCQEASIIKEKPKNPTCTMTELLAHLSPRRLGLVCRDMLTFFNSYFKIFFMILLSFARKNTWLHWFGLKNWVFPSAMAAFSEKTFTLKCIYNPLSHIILEHIWPYTSRGVLTLCQEHCLY